MHMVILRGLPGSGKSTRAKEFVKRGYKRFNKDDLRNMVDDGAWSKTNEIFVDRLQSVGIHTALIARHPIVVDNVHARDMEVNAYRLLAVLHSYDFTVQVLPTPVQVCIDRDSLRDKRVGGHVILKFAKMPFFKSIYG